MMEMFGVNAEKIKIHRIERKKGRIPVGLPLTRHLG